MKTGSISVETYEIGSIVFVVDLNGVRECAIRERQIHQTVQRTTVWYDVEPLDGKGNVRITNITHASLFDSPEEAEADIQRRVAEFKK